MVTEARLETSKHRKTALRQFSGIGCAALNRTLCLPWWIWCASFLWTASPATAQERPESSVIRAPSDTRFPDVLPEGTLPIDAMYMLDSDGDRIFIPNMPMRELIRLREVASGGGSDFQFVSVQIEAIANEESAQVTGRFDVQLGPRTESANVPLNFGTCQLDAEGPQIESDSGKEVVSQFFADASGYRWVLLPQEKESDRSGNHAITLRGKTRITQEGDRRILRISLPMHSCIVKIQLPKTAIDERVRVDDFLEEREERDESVALTVRTRGGDFNISWRSRDTVGRFSTIEAKSQTVFEIDDPRDLWKATTRLSIRWYGSDANDSVRVRLPNRSRWRTYPSDDFGRFKVASVQSSVQGFDGEQDQFAPFDAIELDILNTDPSQNPLIEIPLEWEWLPEDSDSDEFSTSTSIPSPVISGVNYHRGLIDCVCPATYLVVFNEGEGVRLIRQGRVSDAFGSQQLQFKFNQQPFELMLSFRREQSLPVIRPTYHVRVDSNKLIMTAWLDCSFDANQRPLEFRMIFGNWIPQDNTARVVPAGADLFSNDGELLRVETELRGICRIVGVAPEGIGFTGNRRIEQLWRIVAEKTWSPDENELTFLIPSILRSPADLEEQNHGSGVLILSAEDRILLQEKEQSLGLLADSFSTEYQRFVPFSPIRKPLAYRFQSGGNTPVWSGSVELLPQLISVSESAQLEVLEDRIGVQQSFQLQIANVPFNQPRIAVRNDACDLEPLFSVNGLLTSAQIVESMDGEGLKKLLGDSIEQLPSAGTDFWNIYQLVGAPSLFGNAEITTETSVRRLVASSRVDLASENAIKNLDPSESMTVVDVPLSRVILPSNTQFDRRSLRITSEFLGTVRRYSANDDSWLVPSDSSLTMPHLESSVKIGVEPRSADDSAMTRINLSWLQTMINDGERQDRYVAQLSSQASTLKIRLPAQANVRPAPQILIDGVLQTDIAYVLQTDIAEMAAQDVIEVPMPINNGKDEHTFEILYSVFSDLDNWTSFDVAVPELLNAKSTGRFYWQLATPKTQHLTWYPGLLAPEWQWTREGLWWSRKSTKTEQDLVKMLSAADTRLPSSSNQYLLSGQSPSEPFRVLVLARFLLWFPVGTLSIAITALVINFRFFRRPIAGMLLAFAIGAIAMASPDLGVLLGQTAVISLGLVVLVLITHAAIESRVRRRSVFTTRPSTHLDNSDHLSLARVGQSKELYSRQGSSVATGGGG